MTQDWPKEPWSVNGSPRGDIPVFVMDGDDNPVMMIGNAPDARWERITKCVNALAGIRNPEAVRELIRAMRGYYDRGEQIRLPSLLEALDAEPKEPKP